jgi:hypothetical protein
MSSKLQPESWRVKVVHQAPLRRHFTARFELL